MFIYSLYLTWPFIIIIIMAIYSYYLQWQPIIYSCNIYERFYFFLFIKTTLPGMTSYNKALILPAAIKTAGQFVMVFLPIRFILIIAAFLLPEFKTINLEGFYI